jgi:hypothetical protein
LFLFLDRKGNFRNSTLGEKKRGEKQGEESVEVPANLKYQLDV